MEKKEMLTDKCIAQDIREGSTPWHLLPITLALLFCGFIFVWLFTMTNEGHVTPLQVAIETTLLSLYGLLVLGIVSYDIWRIVTWRRIAAKRDFHVVVDKLTAAEDSLDSMESHDYNRHGRSYYLYFSGFGKYLLTNHTYYRWSKMYAMGIRGMMTYAISGDTYYIVTRDNKTILYVYNTKLFDYHTEEHHEQL